MANLIPSSQWDNTYQLETTDAVVGGAGGVANSPHQNLLNRTERIKTTLDLVGIDCQNGAVTTFNSNYLGKVKYLDTLADLRSYSGTEEVVHLKGYYAINDGGGGPLRYYSSGQPAGTYVDNGGSIIVPTGGDGSAAWLWDPNISETNFRWWGASESVDCLAIYNQAREVLDNINGTGIVGTLYIDSGIFEFSGGVRVRFHITGPGTIKASSSVSSGDTLLTIDRENIKISNITIDGNDLANNIRLLEGSSHALIDNVKGNNAYLNHIRYTRGGGEDAVTNVKISNCKLIGCAGAGTSAKCDPIYATGAEHWEVCHNYIEDFVRIGIVFEGDSNWHSVNPHIHHNVIKDAYYVYVTEEPAGIWTERCNGRNVHNNIISNIICDVVYKTVGIASGTWGSTTPPDIIYPFLTYSNTITGCYTGMKNPGIAWGNTITDFQTGYLLSGGDVLNNKQIIKDTFFGYTELEFDGYDWLTTTNKYPACLFLLAGADTTSDITEIFIDGVVVEEVTRATTGDYEYLSDLFIASSAAAGTYEKVTIKNVTTDIGFIARVETDTRVNNLHFENLPMYHHLGTKVWATDSITLKNCAITRGTPTVLTYTEAANKLELLNCSLNGQMRFYFSSTGSLLKLRIQDCEMVDESAGMRTYGDTWAIIQGNTLDNVTGIFLRTYGGTLQAVVNDNMVMNQAGVSGTLLRLDQATDTIAANGNVKDGTDALFYTAVSASITEANTVQV